MTTTQTGGTQYDAPIARAAGAREIRASNVPAALGFLAYKPGGILGTCRQIRPASRSPCAVPCSGVPAAVRRVSRSADAEGSPGRDRADLSIVRLAAAHGCAA